MLRHVSVAPATLKLYERGLAEWRGFCKSHRLPTSGPRIMDSFERFFWHKADRGYSPAIGRAALYGWLHIVADSPSVASNQLDGARKALKGWARLLGDQVRDPLPEELALELLLQLTETGNPLAAAAAAIQLITYARPSEALGLHREDVVLPRPGGPQRYNHVAVIFGSSSRGCVTKGGEQDDTVVIDSTCPAFIPQVLRQLHRICPPGGRIFDELTLSGYEHAVASAADELGLCAFRVVPHTFRHTGPSNDFLQKRRSLLAIQKRGRWKHLRSVTRYEKAGRVLRQWAKLPLARQNRARKAAARFPAILLRALRNIPARRAAPA